MDRPATISMNPAGVETGYSKLPSSKRLDASTDAACGAAAPVPVPARSTDGAAAMNLRETRMGFPSPDRRLDATCPVIKAFPQWRTGM
ncbi:hypothetical protein [Streptomyces brevispora]|uniref:hypothetical protein n=1 Tax=Streptomyces brevispora TaxID=887462 RepID=UPI0035DBCF82